MQLNREMLKDTMPAQGEVFSQAFEGALLEIERSAPEARAQRFPRRRMAFVLAAVLALAAVLGVAEGIRRTIFVMMEQSLPPEQAAVQPLAESLVVTDLGGLATEHLDIQVAEALYDGGTLRLLYTITLRGAEAPLTEGDLADGQSAFMQALRQDGVSLTGPDWFSLNGENISMTGGSRPVYAPGDAPGEAVVYLDIKLSSVGIEPEGLFEVGLPVARGADAQSQLIAFSLEAYALPGVTNLTPATPVERDSVTITVKDLRLSPVKVYLTYRVDIHDDVPDSALLETMACWRNARLVNEAGEELMPVGAVESYGLPEGETDVLRHLEQTLEYVPAAKCPVVLYLAPDTPSSQHYTPDMAQAIPFSTMEGAPK